MSKDMTIEDLDDEAACDITSTSTSVFPNSQNTAGVKTDDTEILDGAAEESIDKMDSLHIVNPKELAEVRIEPKRGILPEMILSLVTFVLVCTDVMRTKVVPSIKGKEIYPEIYFTFGPYAYPVAILKKDWEANTYSSDTDIQVWFYKYDTVSRGIRGILHHDKSDIFPECIMYKSDCEGDFITNEVTFNMLDNFVEHIAHRMYASSQAGIISGEKESRIKFEGIINSGYTNFVIDYLLYHLVGPKKCNMDTKAWYFGPEVARNVSMAMCDRNYVMPEGCSSVWANFEMTTFPDHYTHELGNYISDTDKRLKETQKLFPNHTVDAMVVEVLTYAERKTGALSVVEKHYLDTVTIIRVRECEGSMCKTIQLQDYRYEGGIDKTNIVSWFNVIRILRYTAQIYYYLRIIGLLLGIYHSGIQEECGVAPKGFLAKMKLTIRILFHIPSQIIVYASFFPVFLYALAHSIDSCVTYSISNTALTGIGGFRMENIVEFFQNVSMNMRNIWVYATLTIFAVWIKTSRNWQSQTGVQGVVGHYVAITAFLSLATSYRYRSIRDVRIYNTFGSLYKESASRFNPEDSFIPVESSMSGIYIDLMLILLFTGMYFAILLLVQGIAYLFIGKSGITSPLHLVRATRNLPVTAGTLWSPACLAISWDDDLLSFRFPTKIASSKAVPVDQEEKEESINQSLYRACLMNIAMLTDPFRFLLIKFGHIRLYKFVSQNGQVLFRKEASLKLSKYEQSKLKAKGGFRLIEDISVSEKPWQEIIRYY